MKKLYPLIFLALFFFGACETVEIEKLVYDTIYVDKPRTSLVQTIHVDTVYKELVRVDTVEVTVVVRDTIVIVNNVETVRVDTVFQIQTDSIFIERVVEKIINHYDTVVLTQVVNHTDTIYIDKVVTIHDTIAIVQYDQTVSYLDTAYVMIYMRNVTSIPEAIQPHVNEFYGLASQYGKLTIGGHMIIQYTDDLPGEGWVSHSYWVGGPASIDNPYAQMVIEISERLPPELHRASILRELGRLQLKRKYTVVPDKLMNPLFGPGQAITQQHLNDLFSLPI